MIQHYSSGISICHPFQPSFMPLLRILLLMLQNYKKKKRKSWCLIDWQLSVPNVNRHANSYPLSPLLRWALNFALNDIRSVILHPENYGFDTIIYYYLYRCQRCALTASGYNYSNHRVQNSYQLFRKPWFNTILLLFLQVIPSNPHPYSC